MGPLFIKGVRWFQIGGYLNLDKDPDRVAKQRDRFMLDVQLSITCDGILIVILLFGYWSAFLSHEVINIMSITPISTPIITQT